MKKIIFVGILSILFASASFAQTPKIGLTAGLNTSNIRASSGNYSETGDYKAGFQVGVVADFGITEKFSIIPELLFSQRGTKGKDDSGELEDFNNASLTFNYLQLPINAAYKFDVGNDSKVFVFAGPYIGYALSGKATLGNGSASISGDLPFGSGEDEYKRLDAGVNIGVGYQYDKIFFKLQYNQGLTNIMNITGASVKNMNFAVSVGYYFF